MTLRKLSQLRYLNQEIERDMQRLAELRAFIENPSTSKLSGMPTMENYKNITEKNIIEIITLEGIIDSKIDRCIAEQKEIEEYISGIDDSLTRQIFTLRFIKGLSWRQVAFKLSGNTEESVKKICYRYLRKNCPECPEIL